MSQDDGRYKIGAKRTPQVEPPAAGTGADLPASLAALSDRYGVPAIDVDHVGFPTSNLELIPVEIARRQCVLPVLIREDAIFLAMSDPSDRRVIEELEFVSAKRVFAYVAERDRLAAAIDRAYALRDRGEAQYSGPRMGAPPGPAELPEAATAARAPRPAPQATPPMAPAAASAPVAS